MSVDALGGLVGHWPLQGDTRDLATPGSLGVAYGASAATGWFNGRTSFVDIPHHALMEWGTGDFSLALWVNVADRTDASGDLLTKWDPSARRGFTLNLGASAGGYNGPGDRQYLHFGTDSGTRPRIRSCGRPNPHSNFANSLTVVGGQLYVSTTDAEDEANWAHVYRYVGGESWEDCGRVTNLRSHGVGPLIEHDGALHAATWNHDWTRLDAGSLDACRVYRHLGGTRWEDLGQPGNSLRLVALASYRGQLHTVADDRGAYRLGGAGWERIGDFPRYGHPMMVHDDRLYVGLSTPGHVESFDGDAWHYHGNPAAADRDCTQVHALAVFGSRLHATTWPWGRVARLDDDGTTWVDCGRPGDSTEINALAAYNGALYAGTIPRAGLFRYDGIDQWQPLRDFLAPEGWDPSPATLEREHPDFFRLREWARLTSLTAHRGELFASFGSCTSSVLDAPLDFRGQVFAMKAGEVVSSDRPITPGWHHIVATRSDGVLRLAVDGGSVGEGSAGTLALDVTNRSSLQIGRGPTDHFPGAIRDVRVFDRALHAAEIARLGADTKAAATAEVR